MTAATAGPEGAATGRALRARRINTDLAPVADVNHGSFLGSRSFGSDPGVVAQAACAFADGLQSAGVNATLKHFPGLGRTRSNTDLGAVTIGASAAALRADLEPYRRCGSRARLVMLSNATYPAFDPSRPAVLSRRVVTGLLRGELGFRGVTISDTLGGARRRVVRPPRCGRAGRASTSSSTSTSRRARSRTATCCGPRAPGACRRRPSAPRRRGSTPCRADAHGARVAQIATWGVLWERPSAPTMRTCTASARFSSSSSSLVLAAVPVAAQATDSHAPRGARGDWLPSDEWAMSQWLPYDEATLDHLLHTDRDELASWLNDQRTLGQLARRRGFRDQRALARRLVAARADHPRGARRRVLEQRALDTLTQAHLARHVLFHIYHSPAVGTAARRVFGVSPAHYRALRDRGLSPRRIAAAGHRSESRAAHVPAAPVRRARPPGGADRRDERPPGAHAARRADRHGRRVHGPPVPHDRPAARLRRARLPPARAALNRGAAGRPPA